MRRTELIQIKTTETTKNKLDKLVDDGQFNNRTHLIFDAIEKVHGIEIEPFEKRGAKKRN